MKAAYWFCLAAAAVFLIWAHTHTDELPIVLGLVLMPSLLLCGIFPAAGNPYAGRGASVPCCSWRKRWCIFRSRRPLPGKRGNSLGGAVRVRAGFYGSALPEWAHTGS